MDCDTSVHVSDFKRCKVYHVCRQAKLDTLTFLFLFSFTDCKTCCFKLRLPLFDYVEESLQNLFFA